MFSFFKENGYVWETDLAGHFTYGPQGKRLKNNLENYLRTQFALKEDFLEVDTPLIFRQDVWERSGHWGKFRDPIILTKGKKSFRIDKILEAEDPTLNYSDLTEKEAIARLNALNMLRSGDDVFLVPDNGEIQYQNLMMTTLSGHQMTGLRPETATATYYHYPELLQFQCQELPIKVFQIGKSFRNEISPKHNLIRGREFTQAEFQVILALETKVGPYHEDLAEELMNCPVNYWNHGAKEIQRTTCGELPFAKPNEKYYQDLLALTYRVFLGLGLPEKNIRLRQHEENERAFYALDAWDIEVNLKGLGWTEVAGIHDRGCYDLRYLEDQAIPHILEIAIGVDRLFYSILDNLYEEKAISEGKNMFKIPYYLAPIQVSVLPLVKNKLPIKAKAHEVYRMLKGHFMVEYSEKQSVGKRYLKNAVKGIPYSVTVDYGTLEDDTVTVRDRDTEEQIRVPISGLLGFLFQNFTF